MDSLTYIQLPPQSFFQTAVVGTGHFRTRQLVQFIAGLGLVRIGFHHGDAVVTTIMLLAGWSPHVVCTAGRAFVRSLVAANGR